MIIKLSRSDAVSADSSVDVNVMLGNVLMAGDGRSELMIASDDDDDDDGTVGTGDTTILTGGEKSANVN